MKKLIYPLSLILLCLFLSSWGSKGHKKINQNLGPCLPANMAFLKPAWTNIVTAYASEADNRKDNDPNEAPRHYINIDNYPEFVQHGTIPQAFDSLLLKYGYSFVIDQGTLPWATVTTYDSLKACFQRGDWNKSALLAADLGHYVGDGHMPLHITKNYNGQYTGQSGVHSRYESSMISRYESALVYPADSVQFISDVKAFVFAYTYFDYKYVDSVLYADSYASTAAGSTSSTEYYQALWDRSGAFTIMMMRTGTDALASLIYTAWVEAGSPRMYPNGIGSDAGQPGPVQVSVSPNPVRSSTRITFSVPAGNQPVSIEIYDNRGNRVEVLENGILDAGKHTLTWNPRNCSPGTYFCTVQCGTSVTVKKIVRLP